MANLDNEQVNDINQLKNTGNDHFNVGNYEDALCSYTKALNLSKVNDSTKATLHKNRAAVYLKLGENENALNDCSAALEINPHDIKALFRRCCALEELGRINEAYVDAKLLNSMDPKNSAIQPVITRLHAKVQEMVKMQAKTSSKVDQMFEIVFGNDSNKETKLQAANNLVVLAREGAGADLMFRKNVVGKILKLMKSEKDVEIVTACIRTLGELCKEHIERTKSILQQVTVPQIIESLNSSSEVQVNAAQHAIQTVLNTLSGMNMKDEKRKADQKLVKENDKEISAVMKGLVKNITNRTFTPIARDALIELIMRNVDYQVLTWGEKLLETDGVQRLLEVASEIEEYRTECSILTTPSTRTLVALALQHIYDSLSGDKFREQFRGKVDEFVKEQLRGGDVEPKVRVTAAIVALLQGAVDVGNYCLAQQGVLEMMLVMAGSEDPVQQMVAAEALIAATGKKDKCTSILSQGVNILKQLYHSKNDSIRVRGLVGLCKLGAMGGTDASIRPFADGSAQKLTAACRKLMISSSKDRDIRKWAAEGLSYLTLDAEVKEEIVNDKATVKALVELAQSGDQSVLYGVVTTFVNITNSYDKQEIIPEMLQLAKFAKQHVPEEHPLDNIECVRNRVRIVTELGVTSALVALSKTESKNSKELMARIFNAICEQADLRGLVVQQGGARALIPIALEGTDKGKLQAAQALARIGISINPEVAFPGQRCAEAARPILQLLHPDCTGLENFEALLALCNLARVSATVRNNLMKDAKFMQIEHYIYEDHEMIRRAAVQCMVNLIIHEDMIKLFEKANDRVKYWTLLCLDEDFETAKAGAGGLAMLTEASPKCCLKVFESTTWLDSLRCLLAHESAEMQLRGTCIVENMMNSSSEVAEKLIETDIMEILMAITKLDVKEENKKAIETAKNALKAAEKWKLIKSVEDEN